MCSSFNLLFLGLYPQELVTQMKNEILNCKLIYNSKKSGNNLKCPALGECFNLITGLCNHYIFLKTMGKNMKNT